jgi:hypothetical protein
LVKPSSVIVIKEKVINGFPVPEKTLITKAKSTIKIIDRRLFKISFKGILEITIKKTELRASNNKGKAVLGTNKVTIKTIKRINLVLGSSRCKTDSPG